MKKQALKMRQWPLKSLTIRHLATPSKIASQYKWKSAENVVSLVINLLGAVELQIPGHEKPIVFAANTCNMFYAPGAEGQVTQRDSFNEMVVVQFEAAYFLELMQQFDMLKIPFAAAVKNHNPILLLSQSLPISLPLQKISSDITHLPVDEKYRPLMLSAKAPELLLYLLDMYDKSGVKKWVHCRTAYDRERLEFARTYIASQAANPPSLPELSRIAGINQLKLKMGFKEVFGNTVFGFLNEYRLQKAQEEIALGTKPMAKIAFELGFSSPQHFSTAYKKKFGRAPGKGKKG
ncbi:MAG TPA: AraC family transcriptional regulator [Chitinophagales bacterium]|nr:AraC family transcriptional regulator [Chitinophagales bacterium]